MTTRRAALLLGAAITGGCINHGAHVADIEQPPTEADTAQLRQIVKDCRLHPGALSFERNEVGGYDVRINRGYGDAEERISCATGRLPDSFMRFGLGPIVGKVSGEPSPTR